MILRGFDETSYWFWHFWENHSVIAAARTAPIFHILELCRTYDSLIMQKSNKETKKVFPAGVESAIFRVITTTLRKPDNVFLNYANVVL